MGVSNVLTMDAMFYESIFNQDISSWDVSNVSDMRSMFARNTSFNANISDWDISNLTRSQRMFSGATNFNQEENKEYNASFFKTESKPTCTSEIDTDEDGLSDSTETELSTYSSSVSDLQ